MDKRRLSATNVNNATDLESFAPLLNRRRDLLALFCLVGVDLWEAMRQAMRPRGRAQAAAKARRLVRVLDVDGDVNAWVFKVEADYSMR